MATTGATIAARGDLRPQGPPAEGATRPLEQPVFVADHPWRHRIANATLATAALLLLVWLMAIVAGVLGFGDLPALPLVPHANGTNPGASGSAVTESRPAASGAGSHTKGATAGGGTADTRPAGTSASRTQGAHAGTKSHTASGQPHSVGATPAPIRHGAPKSPVPASNAPTHENGSSGTVGAGSERSASAPAPGEGTPTTTPSGHEVPQEPQGGTVGQGYAVNEGVAGEEHRATPQG